MRNLDVEWLSLSPSLILFSFWQRLLGRHFYFAFLVSAACLPACLLSRTIIAVVVCHSLRVSKINYNFDEENKRH